MLQHSRWSGFQTLTIITERFILDVAAVLDPPLVTLKKCHKHKTADFFSKKKLSGRGTSILDLKVAQDIIIFDIFDLTLSFISGITYLVKQLTLISSTR